ncbi:MAG: gamma carbonic anhydrase family protein [Sterolibacterium sp.]|jgi:carbonic anhydrase/acetyltransferase-like protein (isoleucine patch superfamily)
MSPGHTVPPIILPYLGIEPRIARGVFVAPGASVIGDVELAEGVSIWFGSVLRGDERAIRIGRNSNIQDMSTIHTSRNGWDVEIGEDVTVGHRVVLHGCRIHNRVLIGIGAVVLDEVEIETGAIVAAGATVTPGKRIQSGEVWAGCPAKKIGEVSDAQRLILDSTPPHYRAKAETYLAMIERR